MNRNDFYSVFYQLFYLYFSDRQVESIGTAFVQNADKETIWMRIRAKGESPPNPLCVPLWA